MNDTNRPVDDAALKAAARGLHREWDSPDLWRRIEADLQRSSPWRWTHLAAAAAVVLALGTTGWVMWLGVVPGPSTAVGDREERLLSEQAFEAVERSEEQYTRAIDELSRLVAPKLDMPASDLLISLSQRLEAIDEAIAESRAQIAQNPFNAQLRRQLLYIYQEKRRTLEQIQDHDETSL